MDITIQMDKHLAHNIPDISVVEKKLVWITDVAMILQNRRERTGKDQQIPRSKDRDRKTGKNKSL